MRLLVVEDEARLAEGLKRGLEAEGFAVDVAANGTDGLWLARENGYAVVLLDIMLPGMSGYPVCRTLREEGDWTPVLMLTAKDGEWDQVEALDTGADDYLTKPFSFAVLVARVRALIRRGAAPRPAILEAGDLSLDPATREVHGGECRDRAHHSRVHRARVPHPPCRRGRLEGADPRGRLGLRLRRRPEHRRGVHPAPAQQGRSSVRPRRASRRCEARAIGWRSTVAERRRGPRRPRRRGSVRTRITLVAASVVAVALVLGALGFWLTLRTSLYDGLRNAAEQDAAVIAERIEDDGVGSSRRTRRDASCRSSTGRAPSCAPARTRPHHRSPATTTRRRCASTTRLRWRRSRASAATRTTSS